jgi:hypothetical protein
MGIEGTLDLLWENREDQSATPRYGLVFSRYRGFGNGAQPVNHIDGTENLESYLMSIGFKQPDARDWIAKLRDGDRSVSIPNVTMPPERMAPYEYLL